MTKRVMKLVPIPALGKHLRARILEEATYLVAVRVARLELLCDDLVALGSRDREVANQVGLRLLRL